MKSFNVAQRDDFLKQYVEKNPKVLGVVLKHLDLLSNFMGREISEIEIDYIVIHICAALERRKKKEVEFRVLIVCGGEIGTSQLLLAKMKNRFDFHVVDVVSAHLLNDQKYQDIDLVISTIPLKNYEGEYILVTPIFSDEDYLRVSGKIEDKYIDAMIDNVRENGAYIVISPGFAVPHEGFDRGCNEVGMNLIRLKNPVTIEDIDGEVIEVRFFCCMSTEDHKKHMKAFFHLVNMLTNRGFKEELSSATTSKEAADIIRKYEMRIKQ